MTEGGPRYNGQTAPQLATAAQENIQGISHLVEAYDVPLDIETVYRTLSALSRAVEQIPRAVGLLGEAAKAVGKQPGFVVTGGPFSGDPDAALTSVEETVADLLAGFGGVSRALNAAQAALSEARSRLDPTA